MYTYSVLYVGNFWASVWNTKDTVGLQGHVSILSESVSGRLKARPRTTGRAVGLFWDKCFC